MFSLITKLKYVKDIRRVTSYFCANALANFQVENIHCCNEDNEKMNLYF